MSTYGALFPEGKTHAYAAPQPHTPGVAAEQWYSPAHTLSARSVLVVADTPTLLSGASSARKFCGIANLSSTVTLSIGDSQAVTVGLGAVGAGFPIGPGATMFFAQQEYDGPVWGRTPAGSADVDVRVIDPAGG